MVNYPSLYQINTRVWLRELSDRLGRAATLADIPDAFLDQVAALGRSWRQIKATIPKRLGSRGMKTVDRETLKGWLGQPDLFLMDVRNAADWNRSIAKIDNAHRFDPERLSKMVRDIPKNKKLVLYCEDGKTSCPTMAHELEKMGFTNLYFLEGGFKVWQGKEYPVVPKEYMSTAPLSGKGVTMLEKVSIDRRIRWIGLLSVIIICGCEGLMVENPASLLFSSFKRSEILGMVAGFGTTFAAVPDLFKMFRRRSSKGINPTMAGIMGVFQIIWVYYGLLIASRPVILWNFIAVIINFMTVWAYFRFARREMNKAKE